jgi:FixJ family two-component response regulator
MMSTPLIHIVDDDDSLRTAVLRLLSASGYEARGYASTGDFLLHANLEGPGCLLLDLNLPGPSGLELQEELLRRGVTLPVVFLTGRAGVPESVRAMKSGAEDFLTKPVERQTLLEALDRALARDASQRAARDGAERLLARFRRLTPRERDVFERIVIGRLNKQIADELGIAERTVKLQRAQLMEKLGVGSAAELGRFAERLKSLSP